MAASRAFTLAGSWPSMTLRNSGRSGGLVTGGGRSVALRRYGSAGRCLPVAQGVGHGVVLQVLKLAVEMPALLDRALWGSRSRPEPATCGDRPAPDVGHDRPRTASRCAFSRFAGNAGRECVDQIAAARAARRAVSSSAWEAVVLAAAGGRGAALPRGAGHDPSVRCVAASQQDGIGVAQGDGGTSHATAVATAVAIALRRYCRSVHRARGSDGRVPVGRGRACPALVAGRRPHHR